MYCKILLSLYDKVDRDLYSNPIAQMRKKYHIRISTYSNREFYVKKNNYKLFFIFPLTPHYYVYII